MTNVPPSPRRSSDYFAIVPYREEWVQEYRGIVVNLRSAFPADAIFHHIGSTAVPGLAAKDVIDIQATVLSLDSVDADHLARMGFSELEGALDHAPAGRTSSAPELTKRFFQSARRPTNLHVRIAGHFNQRYPLLCRDYLRSHSVTAASYQLIKERLISWFPGDAERYYDVKDPLFDVIMDGAEAWATLTGWRPPPPDV